MDHVLKNAKAYAALVGSVCTALLGIYAADSQLGRVLTVVAAVATAVGTWSVPNAQAAAEPNEDGAADAGILIAFATLLGVVLLLFGVQFNR